MPPAEQLPGAPHDSAVRLPESTEAGLSAAKPGSARDVHVPLTSLATNGTVCLPAYVQPPAEQSPTAGHDSEVTTPPAAA